MRTATPDTLVVALNPWELTGKIIDALFDEGNPFLTFTISVGFSVQTRNDKRGHMDLPYIKGPKNLPKNAGKKNWNALPNHSRFLINRENLYFWMHFCGPGRHPFFLYLNMFWQII